VFAPTESSTAERPVSSSLVDIKRAATRRKIVEEILTSEQSYVQSLADLENYLLKPLTVADDAEKRVLKRDHVDVLFGNISAILDISKSLVEDLEVRVASSDQSVGDLFNHFGVLFKMYIHYASNYNNAMAVLESLEKNDAFCKMVAASLPQCRGGNSLTCYLILPLQRIPRYRLLLDTLVKHTDSQHPDYDLLLQATSLVADVAVQIDQSVNDPRSRAAMRALADKFVNFSAFFQQPGRYFVRQGPLTSVTKHKAKVFQCLLFSDSLLLATRTPVTNKLKAVRTMPINRHFQLDSTVDEDCCDTLVFSSSSSSDNVIASNSTQNAAISTDIATTTTSSTSSSSDEAEEEQESGSPSAATSAAAAVAASTSSATTITTTITTSSSSRFSSVRRDKKAPLDVTNAFQVLAGREVWTLVAANAEDKKLWVADLASLAAPCCARSPSSCSSTGSRSQHAHRSIFAASPRSPGPTSPHACGEVVPATEQRLAGTHEKLRCILASCESDYREAVAAAAGKKKKRRGSALLKGLKAMGSRRNSADLDNYDLAGGDGDKENSQLQRRVRASSLSSAPPPATATAPTAPTAAGRERRGSVPVGEKSTRGSEAGAGLKELANTANGSTAHSEVEQQPDADMIVERFWRRAAAVVSARFSRQPSLHHKLSSVMLVLVEARTAALDVFQALKWRAKSSKSGVSAKSKGICSNLHYHAMRSTQAALSELADSLFFFLGTLSASTQQQEEEEQQEQQQARAPVTAVEAPVALLEERLGVLSPGSSGGRLLSKLFTTAPNLRTLRKETEELLRQPQYYSSVVVLLYATDVIGKASVQTLQHTELRRRYLPSLMQAFQCARGFVWAQLAQEGLQVSFA